ncbi:MAG: DNA polymerase III subunit delta [Pseudomonadota bacterium]
MKLNAAAAEAFVDTPNLDLCGALLHGPDSGVLARARQQMVAAIAEGDDLRLTNLDGAVATKEIADLDGALRARGFFPGRRAVVVEGAKDGLAKGLTDILDDLTAEDAFLIVVSGQLNARSSLRKLFEGHRSVAALGLYPKAMTANDVSAHLRKLGFKAAFSPDAENLLVGTLAAMDPGAANQLIEKIAISFSRSEKEIGPGDLAPHLPLSMDAAADDLIDAVIDGRPEAVGPLLRKVTAGGTNAIQIMIQTSRRFRDLVSVSGADDGIDAAIGRLRPPVFGPRRQRVAAAVWRWGTKLESATRLLYTTERQLRSAGSRPDDAMVERCLLRLAMMGARSERS